MAFLRQFLRRFTPNQVHGILGRTSFPEGAILHWDANTDPYLEKAEFGHTFNYNVLGPQYELQADGSYTDVGAKPAVDTFDGERWVRSCGAVTAQRSGDYVPSSATGSSLVFTIGHPSPNGSMDATMVYVDNTEASRIGYCVNSAVDYVSGVKYTNTVTVKSINERYFQLTHAIYVFGADQYATFDLVAGVVVAAVGGEASIFAVGDGWYECSFTSTAIDASSGASTIFCSVNSGDATRAQSYVGSGEPAYYLWHPIYTATSYPVPYTPPGTTMPASNATTTNGSWFTLPDGSELWHALDGEIQPQDLITNGNFDTNIDGWNVYEPTAAILSWQNGKLRIQNNGGTYGAANQAFSTVVGGIYEVTVDIINCSPGIPARVRVDTSPGFLSSGTINTTTSGTYKFRFVATVTTSYLLLGNRDATDAYNEFDNISIQRIQPQPLTLATRVRMGVGSGDLASAGDANVFSCRESVFNILYSRFQFKRLASSHDGGAFPASGQDYLTWPRFAVVNLSTQVSADGTQYRVGYMIEGTHTAIQWSSWANYDGSFNPSTLYRLMLGYNNPYPMWYNKITAWKEQVDDSRILDAWA